jgi:short-subunit dehydrogenase
MMSGRIATAASVALAGYRGLMAGRTLVIPGFRNRFLVFCVRLLPRKAAAAVVRGIQDQRSKAPPT